MIQLSISNQLIITVLSIILPIYHLNETDTQDIITGITLATSHWETETQYNVIYHNMQQSMVIAGA